MGPMDAWIVLGLVVVSIAMFAIERIPLEVTSLALITLLALSGVLTPAEAFSGLSNETVIFIFTLLAMTQGLASTGVMQIVGRRAAFARWLGERSFLGSLLVTVTAFSSLASNTAVTAAFLPVASATASRAGIPRSQVLMPMAYASMLGGMIFLYGTSTNLVVSEAMTRLGMEPLGFAELLPAGLPAALLALGLLIFGSRFLMPSRAARPAERPVDRRTFVTEAVLPEGSRLIGRTVDEIARGLDFEIVGLVREGRWIRRPAQVQVAAGDHLLIRGGARALIRLQDLRSLLLEAELHLAGSGPQVIAETYVPPHSALIGRSIREFHLVERLGLVVLALHRHPHFYRESDVELEEALLTEIPLAPGDVLLVSGSPQRLRELTSGELLGVLGSIDYSRPRYRKAALAVLIFAASLFAAASGLAPAAVAGLVGILTMLATRCVDAREAFRIEWRVVLLIGALLALGQGMEKSGAGELLAQGLVPLADTIGARGLLFVVMAITVFLSAPMSNQAAALVVLPMAISVAGMLDLNPRTFAIATTLAASCSFMTPLEPSAALVYGPGRYRFVDFLRAGTPLTLLLLALFVVLVPLFWPLQAAS